MRSRVVAATLLLLSLGLASCGGSSPTTEEVAEGKALPSSSASSETSKPAKVKAEDVVKAFRNAGLPAEDTIKQYGCGAYAPDGCKSAYSTNSVTVGVYDTAEHTEAARVLYSSTLNDSNQLPAVAVGLVVLSWTTNDREHPAPDEPTRQRYEQVLRDFLA